MTSVAPAHRAEPPMTHTPDLPTTSQAQIVDDAVAERPARPRLRDQIAANPLLSLGIGLTLALFTFLGTVTMGLLLFTLNDINDGLDNLGSASTGLRRVSGSASIASKPRWTPDSRPRAPESPSSTRG